MSVILLILSFILIVVSVFMIFLVLAQPAKADGMGSALGGGMAEAAFGGGHSTVISKLTIKAAVAFFVLSFLLYLGNVYQRSQAVKSANGALPNITAPAPAASPSNSQAEKIRTDLLKQIQANMAKPAQPAAPSATQPAVHPSAGTNATTVPAAPEPTKH